MLSCMRVSLRVKLRGDGFAECGVSVREFWPGGEGFLAGALASLLCFLTLVSGSHGHFTRFPTGFILENAYSTLF